MREKCGMTLTAFSGKLRTNERILEMRKGVRCYEYRYSSSSHRCPGWCGGRSPSPRRGALEYQSIVGSRPQQWDARDLCAAQRASRIPVRSEEHTSELQS